MGAQSEQFPGVEDRVAAPTVPFLVLVVGGLFSGQPGDFGLGDGDRSGGIDRCGAEQVDVVAGAS